MTNYIKRLTDYEIEAILNKNGYELMHGKCDCEGNALKSILRGNSLIMVRVKNRNSQTIDIFKELKISNPYDDRFELIQITDFFIRPLNANHGVASEREISLQADFEKVMCEKFPDFKIQQKHFVESQDEKTN